MLLLRKQPQAVLDDDDRTVDDDAEVDGAERHEVRTDLILDHSRHGNEHRQGNDERGGDGRSEVAEDQQQDHDDEDRALEQILLYGRDRGLDEARTVVKRPRHHTFGQGFRDLVQLCRYTLGHRAAVFADEQHGRPDNGLAPIQSCRTGTELSPFDHFCDVADPDRDPFARPDHDVSNVARVAHLPRRANQVLLAVSFDVARADVGIVRRKRGHHIAKIQPIRHQLGRIGQDVELPLEPTDGVDLDYAGYRPQLRLDDPILDRAEVYRADLAPVGVLGCLLRLDGEHEYLAEARRNRSHRHFDAVRQEVFHLLQTLVDQLAREIDVRAVGEDDGDLA